jgi:molecular chaperone HtpG
VGEILEEQDEERRKQKITEAKDLALLAQNLLHGEALTNFVEKHFDQLGGQKEAAKDA